MNNHYSPFSFKINEWTINKILTKVLDFVLFCILSMCLIVWFTLICFSTSFAVLMDGLRKRRSTLFYPKVFIVHYYCCCLCSVLMIVLPINYTINPFSQKSFVLPCLIDIFACATHVLFYNIGNIFRQCCLWFLMAFQFKP